MTASAGALVSFEESGALLHELAGVEVSVKQVERAAEALGAEIAVDERQDVARMREVPPPCIWAWMAPGCPCARKKSQTARASKPTARRKLARPSWSLSGRRNREIGKANPWVVEDRSAIRARLKAPPLRIPVPTCRIFARSYSARTVGPVSTKPRVR